MNIARGFSFDYATVIVRYAAEAGGELSALPLHRFEATAGRAARAHSQFLRGAPRDNMPVLWFVLLALPIIGKSRDVSNQ